MSNHLKIGRLAGIANSW